MKLYLLLAVKHCGACAPAAAAVEEDVDRDFGLDVKKKENPEPLIGFKQICRSRPTKEQKGLGRTRWPELDRRELQDDDVQPTNHVSYTCTWAQAPHFDFIFNHHRRTSHPPLPELWPPGQVVFSFRNTSIIIPSVLRNHIQFFLVVVAFHQASNSSLFRVSCNVSAVLSFSPPVKKDNQKSR